MEKVIIVSVVMSVNETDNGWNTHCLGQERVKKPDQQKFVNNFFFSIQMFF